MTPEVDETPPETDAQKERPAPPHAGSGDERPAPRPAWPMGAIAEGMPRWLAWIVLIALLGAGVATTWLVLTQPPATAPVSAPTGP